MAFSTLGIIYSDIGEPIQAVRRRARAFHSDYRDRPRGATHSETGTSPLYVLNGIWSSSGDAPSEEEPVGGISAIVWSLTPLPLLKYVRVDVEKTQLQAAH